jgi:hypothetical protein
MRQRCDVAVSGDREAVFIHRVLMYLPGMLIMPIGNVPGELLPGFCVLLSQCASASFQMSVVGIFMQLRGALIILVA